MHKFRSRVSVLLLLFVVLTVVPVFFFGEPNEEAWVAFSVLGLSIGIVLLMLFGMSYEIGENYLIIKVGPIPYSRIKLSEIEKVERSYNPLSSPAASLKRLYVKGKNKDLLISPSDEEEFIRILKQRNPHISVKIDDGNDEWWKFWNWDV
ncbi:MAG: PH domain-containing protein [Flavobacteriales bacterium]|nr:PH domain-containing protein [Flavobacteriales bacterium]MCB9190450.1 PH domain-containing protein [Flavobacteriales bacterium]